METYNRIKRVVNEILFDPLVYNDFELVGPADHGIPKSLGSADKEHESKRLFYVNRFALLYAILLQEQKQMNALDARPTPSTVPPSRSARRRKKKPSGIMRLDPKKVTVVLMYMLTNGLNIGEQNVMSSDQFLKSTMPIEDNLVWYGIDSQFRQAYLKVGTMPAKARIKYSYDRALAQYIQKLFNGFSGGPYLLTRIMNDGLG